MVNMLLLHRMGSSRPISPLHLLHRHCWEWILVVAVTRGLEGDFSERHIVALSMENWLNL